MAKRMSQLLVCTQCEKSFSRIISVNSHKPKRVYCSNECRKSDRNSYKSEWTKERREQYSQKFSGQNNPNFGNSWSDEQRMLASDRMFQRYRDDPNFAYEVGKSNRGVKFDKERIEKMHGHRTFESYSRPLSEHSKTLIGRKSKEKWTEEYKIEHRKTMEDLGHWISLENKSQYDIYYKDANWIDNMIEFFSENEKLLLNEYGIFSSKNTKGYVRDHIVSRKIGFEFSVPPQIIRHPANLQFISHAQNITKGFLDDKLTVNEKHAKIQALIEKIMLFSLFWKEQDSCLLLIKERRLSDA